MSTIVLRPQYVTSKLLQSSCAWRIMQYVMCTFHLTFSNLPRQVSNIRRTLVGNKIVDSSDVVGASPVGAAPTTYSLST